MIQFRRRQNLTFDNTLPIQTVRGTVYTYVHVRVAQGKLAIFTKIGVQTYNVYIVELIPFHASVICFSSFGCTSVQGISNIYWRILHIVVRTKLILKVRIFTKEFSKHTPQIETTL